MLDTVVPIPPGIVRTIFRRALFRSYAWSLPILAIVSAPFAMSPAVGPKADEITPVSPYFPKSPLVESRRPNDVAASMFEIYLSQRDPVSCRFLFWKSERISLTTSPTIGAATP